MQTKLQLLKKIAYWVTDLIQLRKGCFKSQKTKYKTYSYLPE